MKVHKTNEKIALWMFRTSVTQQEISDKLGVTRQTFASKLKDNYFSNNDLCLLRELGFSDE